MDGNRRWAKEHHFPLMRGHFKGYSQVEKLITHAQERHISHLTFWAFSTENWNRDKREVTYLMTLFRKVLHKDRLLKNTNRKKVKFIFFGDLSKFPDDIQKNVQELAEETQNNTAITVNIAINYGGRAEIIRAVNELLQAQQTTVDEQTFSKYLYSVDQPDPDLIIRTGGENRLSGYLPWQSVYSELYFTKTFWPDFDEQAFDEALEEYQRRQRRFGK